MSAEIRIPGFNLQRPLSRGASAEVYLAEQLNPRRKVALKLVPLKQGLDETFVNRLQNEGDITARFTHQNLVTVYACGVVEDHYYLAMEYLPGGDLATRMEAGLDHEQIIAICRDVASGLAYIHQRKAIHRDIKPANVMFNEEGRAVLVDFGIAKLQTADSTLTKMGLRSGTPHYMSPEQAQGKPMDGRSDLYSLGIMLYEMLTGTTPFTGDDDIAIAYSHVHERARSLPAKFAHFQPLINKLIAKQASWRYANAEALIQALDKLQQPDQQAGTRTGNATALIKATSQDWWHEMQQRRVFRVAAIYFVLAWGFTEIATTVLEGFNAPQWTITTVLVLFVSGFPVAIVLAWLFEISPDGIRRTPPASGRGIFAIMLSISLLIAATGLVVWFPEPGDSSGLEPPVQPVAAVPVVAVLPFRDRSPDQSLVFLGDGLAEELLNRLARADGINTIGRTSSFLLAEQDLTVAEIAGKLKANLIVEGSIRQQGEQLVISVSLIDPLSGQTQWTESYNEVMADVFDVQERIARAVVGKITGEENANVDAGRIGTSDPEAYQLYLRAHHGLHNAALFDVEEIAAKRGQLKQAIALDPAFAMAYLDLASAYYLPTWVSEERDHPFMELAANYVRQAIRLEPDSAEAHAMLAIIETLRYNWESSFAAYEQAVALISGPPAIDSLAYSASNWGYLQQTLDIDLAWYERDPLEAAVAGQLAAIYAMTGQLDQTLKYMAIRKELGGLSGGWEIYFLMDQGQEALARATMIEWWGDDPDAAVSCIPALCNANRTFELMLGAKQDPSMRATYIAALGAAVKNGQLPEFLVLMEYVNLQAADLVFETAQNLWEKRMLNPVFFWQLRGGPIRQDPRFLELMETIGLFDFWKVHGPPDFCEPAGDSFVCN